MKTKLLILLLFIAQVLIIGSCKHASAPEMPSAEYWITPHNYDFPIYIGMRGGVVTTDLETFAVTGFCELGDPAAYSDSLEWKVLPFQSSNNKTKELFDALAGQR